MTRYLRLTIDLEADVLDSPQGNTDAEEIELIRRISDVVAADETALLELAKGTFLTLLAGDYYTEQLTDTLKPTPESKIFQSVNGRLPATESVFLRRLFDDIPEDVNASDIDEMRNLLASRFSDPEIINVRFDFLANTDCSEEDH